jgi:hypothetical protein
MKSNKECYSMQDIPNEEEFNEVREVRTNGAEGAGGVP